jgi:hypothetical protein
MLPQSMLLGYAHASLCLLIAAFCAPFLVVGGAELLRRRQHGLRIARNVSCGYEFARSSNCRSVRRDTAICDSTFDFEDYTHGL